MKVLAQGIPGCTYSGFQRAVEATGGTWIWWQEQHTPAFDVFDEVKPDCVFMMEPSRALTKCIAEFKPVVIQGNDDPFIFDLGEDMAIDFQRLYDARIFNNKDEDGCVIIDPFPAYECDVCISASPNALGLKVCDVALQANIKVISEQPWPVSQYIGAASIEQKREMYLSANTVIVDHPLEAMRAMACGAMLIVFGSNPAFGDEFDEFIAVETDNIINLAVDALTPELKQEYTAGYPALLKNKSYDFAWRYILEQANEKGQLPD